MSCITGHRLREPHPAVRPRDTRTHGDACLTPGPLLRLLDVSHTDTPRRVATTPATAPCCPGSSPTPEGAVTRRGLCRTDCVTERRLHSPANTSTNFLKGKHCRVENTGGKNILLRDCNVSPRSVKCSFFLSSELSAYSSPALHGCRRPPRVYLHPNHVRVNGLDVTSTRHLDSVLQVILTV